MSASLSSLIDKLSEINEKECKTCIERNNIKSEWKFIEFKNNRLNYKCKECNDKSCKLINRLNKKFPNTYQFCNEDVNKFVPLLRKGAYPYEYMDSWEKFGKNLIKHRYQIKNLFTAN